MSPDSLFFHRTDITHKTNFKRILAATILIFHDAFLGIVANKASGKYKVPTHYPFHHKITPIIPETKMSMETFNRCQDEVIEGFNGVNGLWLTFQKLSKFMQKGILIVFASL